MAKKFVYLFEEGNKDMRALLGGKGANLAEMTKIGLQVAFLTDEIGNAVAQKLDILRFKAASRYFLKQMVFGFLPKPLQIMLVVVIDGLTRQGVQEAWERLCLKPM